MIVSLLVDLFFRCLFVRACLFARACLFGLLVCCAYFVYLFVWSFGCLCDYFVRSCVCLFVHSFVCLLFLSSLVWLLDCLLY